MTLGNPLVSIGLPVWNGERFVARALAALAAQDYEPLEVVVSDNGSSDDTEEICRTFVAADSRFRYYRSDENRGAAWNFVRVFSLSRGEYFKWAAHDDLCAPEFVRVCAAVLGASGGDVVLCYPSTALIDVDDRTVGEFEDGLALDEPAPHQRLARLLGRGIEYHPIFGLIRRKALAATQVMGAYVAADIVTLAELALMGRFAEVPERLFLRRYHDGTSVRANPDAADRATWFDPSRRWRSPMPASRLAVELTRAVSRSSLPGPERVRCAGVVARHWIVPRWRDMGGETKRVLLAAGPRTRAP